ncbi:MAG: phosphate ABC transporter substrate-binding protein [Actinomycetota bacterium]|nr:phosphate ABC transporter substrate-binding protein [Actinomycetota bacterium]
MKTSRWAVLALVALLVIGAVALTGCGAADEETTETTESGAQELTGVINVEGSDTIVNMGQAWAEEFMDQNPGVMITVKGGGSGTGIASLINGTIDFADASRGIKDSEVEAAKVNGVDPVEHTVARDGIAVIVNPANPVGALSSEQIGAVYRGEITNWSEVGGQDMDIVLLSRDSSSGTYEFFKEAVVGEDAEYAKEARLLVSNQAIVDETAGNEGAIGYIGVGYITDGISVLEVDGTAASVEAVLAGDYAISRALYMYSDGEVAGAAAAYLEWITGPEGQKIVEGQGFVPLG